MQQRINKIGGVVSKMMKDIDEDGYYTNHSLKRTCYSRLIQGGISADKSMKRTGHRSLDGAMEYDVQTKEDFTVQDQILNGQACSSREANHIQSGINDNDGGKYMVNISIQKPNGEIITIKL